MIFSEIYGNYFIAVSEILREACEGELTRERMYSIINEKGFGESTINIPKSIFEQWGLLTPDMKTPIKNPPSTSLTLLEKRWLRAVLSDKRIKLFGVDDKGLEDVEPLFNQDTFVYFDRFADGDDFENEDYIRNFKTILTALKKEKAVSIKYLTRSGVIESFNRLPIKLEYSSKDDKFRLITINKKSGGKNTYNLAKIIDCNIISANDSGEAEPYEFIKTAEILITDRRNAFERAMLNFSHLEKESQQIDENHYKLTIHYDKNDETEILIRILSFGPMVKLLSPKSLVEQLKERIFKQQIAD